MVGNAGKRGNLAAVDNTFNQRAEPDRLVTREDREFRALLRRERAGAYWFAATKWGILGLVAGTILGGVGMYYASVSTLDLAQDAVTKGAIVERLRQQHDAQENGVQPAVNPAR